jgi:uncharacterized protein (DUF58 family)
MGSLARQLRFVFLGTVLVVAAFSTGISFLFFLVYLLGALLVAAWFYARRGLNGLRAGYQVVNPRAQVGDTLRAVYRLDNTAGLGKPWVEIWNDSTLPTPMPGRAIGIGPRDSRQWQTRLPLQRRGSYRLGALRVRTGDPFGLFTSEMVVGQPTWIVVFPRVHALPHWRLPPSPVDGTAPSRRRFEAASPLVSSIRPYVHGDAINRIHWLTSVRHGELHVKEFDVEQTADLWILLDLERTSHAGVGDNASVEMAVSAAASIAVQTLIENRAVGLTVSSRRQHVLTPDRGTRVEQKVLHLLANVQADGTRPLAEVLLETLPQMRRGMTLCIVTGSTDREWVRALASLRRRGVGTVVVLLDRDSFASHRDDETKGELAAVRHALAEYDIGYHLLSSGDDLADALGGSGAGRRASPPKVLTREELNA